MRNADLIAIGASFCTTFAVLPLILSFAWKYKLYDPSGPLKIHTVPTPRLGGVAITAGIVAGTVVSAAPAAGSGKVYISLVLVWGAGLIDDLFGLSPWIRLMIQSAAGVLVWLAGWSVPIGRPGLSLLATILFIVCFVNALNMLDGADGIAARVSSIIAVGFIFLTLPNLDPWGRAVAFSLSGVALVSCYLTFPPPGFSWAIRGAMCWGWFSRCWR